uniref:Krueppel homolog 2 n=1 Tax=Cacopsylla melanoneura TaxID=428564 RepID=A0A8D9A2K4_9HEMI
MADTQQAPRPVLEVLKEHAISHKVDVTLWATRLAALLFTTIYFIPIVGNPVNSYYKVLMANAAISALRLHQRLPPFTFSKEFFNLLMLEDSFHYLWFSLIYLYVQPITLALLPVFLFSMIHFASYSLTLLDTLGQNSWWGARLLISLVEFQSNTILRLIAFAEIFLMPFVIIMILMGRAGLFTPFMYYNFLKMRYASRRNPHTRNMFLEIRQGVEKLAASPRCPDPVKKILLGGIQFVCRLAPPPAEAQQ